MKRLFLASFLIFTAFRLSAVDYVPGQIIVRHRSFGSPSLSQIPTSELIKLDSTTSVSDAIALYKNKPDVISVQPNYIYKIANTQQWALKNTGQTFPIRNGTIGADIEATLAWTLVTGNENPVIVAVIDTGVDYNHPDLRINTLRNDGWDFANGDNDPMDDNFHGTFVSGLIAGSSSLEANGVCGVNPYARILPIKALDASGSGSTFNIVQGIYWAIAHKATIINASFGSYFFDQMMFDAIKAAGDANVLFVAAAGNDHNDNDVKPFYPSSYALPNVISVGASQYNDERSVFSNYGATTVDFFAPGEYNYSSTLNNGYAFGSGTSFAAPHVAGVASLVLAKCPNLPVASVKKYILLGASPKSVFNGESIYPSRLDAYQTLLLARIAAKKTVPDDTVRVNKEYFFIHEGVDFTVTSLHSGNGSLKIYNVNQKLIRDIPFSYYQGANSIHWDGKDSEDQYVLTDIYWAVFNTSEFGKKIIHIGAIR